MLVLEAGRITDADRAVIRLLPAGARVVVALNKIDRQKDRDALLPQMAELAALYPFSAIVPVSAEKERALDALLAEVRALLPEGAPIFGADEITDRDERFLAAEFVREKIFRLLGEEVPYATTVAIDRFEQEGALRRIHATVYRGPREPARDPARCGRRADEGDRVDGPGRHGAPVRRQGVPGGMGAVKGGWADDEALLTRFGY